MPPRDLLIVAIGASAGGLEACTALLRDMPGDVPAAFILILHLDPSHDSMMVDLLARHTQLKVVQATEGMALRPGHVHVIPPGVYLTVRHHTLHLASPDAGAQVRLPFDALLRSLAGDTATSAACVVLSGTGTDGSAGIADIHAAGGLIIAQEPEEAGYAGMPESAIATGCVTKILPTSGMAAAIEDFARTGIAEATAPAPDASLPTARNDPSHDARAAPTLAPNLAAKQVPTVHPDVGYDDLLTYLAPHATQDILLYKRGTLERRIARRMALLGLSPDDIGRYLAVLKVDAGERDRLSADLLIHVTSFFRDEAVFDHLSVKIIPDILAALPEDRRLRIWVAGCSTGEEAYSFAIILLEQMKLAGSEVRLQILASDVDPEAIATARTGYYPKEIEATVSPERLARFFIPVDGGYRVGSMLRDVIVFTVADLLSDPPFSRIDIVSCRNVLIYLGPGAQKRVLARCCFALRPNGLLLLGAAEMPVPGDSCFALEDKATRLWRRVGRSHPADLNFAAGTRPDATTPASNTPVRRSALADLCRRVVLEHYAPAAVLLNTRLDVLYLLGPTERYLTITQGHPEPGILAMLPKVLRARVRAAAASCSKANPKVIVSGGRVAGGSGFDIALHVVSTGPEPMLLACFIDTAHPTRAWTPEDTTSATAAAESGRAAEQVGDLTEENPGESTGDTAGGHEADLEADLAAARSDLHAALRDLEQEVEAHGVDTAEALSVNEEFQSTNEELLASKEELQSLNEELTALNSQLQETLERQRTTSNDLRNVLYSTDVATLFLDLDLNIRFFTPAARAIFRVIPGDVGRPLSDLSSVSKDEAIAQDARDVLASSDPMEREVEGAGDKWFLRRIQPYRAEGGQVEGVVITYFDITERKRSNEALRAAMNEASRATRAKSRFLAAASHDLRQPLQAMALLHALLARQKPSSEATRLTGLLDETLVSMTSMLDTMLDVNRIESGIVRPNMQPIPIAPLMKRLADEFSPQSELKGLILRSVPCSAWVQTDPQLLEQILRNLLSNALKYTPNGRILMGCRRRGDRLTIRVCDTGIGVPEADTAMIFDAYRRGETASELAAGGLGLGLSIVQRLSALMEHPLDMKSTVGKGSMFMITLPVVDPALKTATAAQPGPGPDNVDEVDKTGRILVVEDEDGLRTLLAEVLTKAGHKVILHADTKAAMAWASGDVDIPDLLLTDFDLRGSTSGLKLAQDLPDVLGVTVPCIILTGDITHATKASIAATACHQVTKPVMPKALLSLIADMLTTAATEKAKAARQADATSTNVILIDDDPRIRAVMRRLFEAEGWQAITYASAEDFLEAPRPDGPTCLVVDNLLPGMNGVSLINRLRERKEDLPVVMLTGHGDAALAVAAMKAGAADLIEKPASASELLSSVRQAIKGAGKGRAPSETRKTTRARFDNLTRRERDVLGKVLDGVPNKIIAADLGINQRTVENHRAAVMRKTGAASLPELVRLALLAEIQNS